MAMIKLGYTEGLFVTDARISPQAKREYLGDYPGLRLDFLDRDELLAEVLSKTPLRALWFDGASIAAVNSRIMLPVLVRRHEGDTPLLPLRRDALIDISKAVATQLANEFGVEVDIQEGISSAEPFEPYRPPKILTLDEGGMRDVRVTEFGFRGHFALSDIERARDALGLQLTQSLSGEVGPLTIVVGSPSVTPLAGGQAGMRTSLDNDAVAFVGLSGQATTDRSWYTSSSEDGWSDVSDARVSESNQVRISHLASQLLASLDIESSPAPIHALIRQHTQLAWAASTFALIPKWNGPWAAQDIPAPDESVDWPFSDMRFCGWLHHSISGNVPISLERDRGDESRAEHDSELARLRDIATKVAGLSDAHLIESSKARYMLAFINHDPFDQSAPTRCHTADVLAAFDTIARPIDPEARSSELTMAWECHVDADRHIHAATGRIATELSATGSTERVGEFFVATLAKATLPRDVSTPAWLRLATAVFEKHLGQMEDDVRVAGLSVRRATFEYWKAATGIRIGVEWHASDKDFMWQFTETGIVPVKVRPEDLEDPESDS